jgi:polyisoprenoid-binding protein YceI
MKMKMKLIQLLTLTFFTLTSAMAADIDLKSSTLKWHGTKVTGKHFGKIYFKKGSVDMKDGKLSGGNFVVDMTTFTVDDLEGEWATKFSNHMKSDDFFTVKKHPTSSLKIKSVKGNKVTADLTIKGKTNEVKFDIVNKGKAYSGKLKFDRTKFGMVYGSGDFFKGLGDKMIHNEVVVDFNFTVK